MGWLRLVADGGGKSKPLGVGFDEISGGRKTDEKVRCLQAKFMDFIRRRPCISSRRFQKQKY
jgi:hypothetical protein